MGTSATDADALDHTERLGSIIHSNQAIRRHVQAAVNEFLSVSQKLLHDLKAHKLDQLDQLKPFAETMNIQTLNQQVTSEKIQLALCGENSSGKTSFLHMLLDIGEILPSGVGPVTARIIKLTYADPEQAVLRVFKSLQDSLGGSASTRIEEVDLSSFFKNAIKKEDVNWQGIKDATKRYIMRPDDLDPKSAAFAEWARHLVEISLPSPTLKCKIDVYDTPGFLFDDAPVLKEILSNLVVRVHPTLVFLYDNASTSDDMNNCYLAVKGALKQPDSTSFFYLNNKTDIEYMNDVADDTTIGSFQEILSRERDTRYRLLKEAPCLGTENLSGLPESVDKCNCFDICSVVSHNDELGAYMNNCAIRRLVQFVANSDLVVAKRVTSLVLPAIEAFFDLTLIISHRTLDQLQQLRRDALSWHRRFLGEHKTHFNKFLADVYGLIEEELKRESDRLIQQAAKCKDGTSIEYYLRLQVKHGVIKQTVSNALSAVVKTILDMLLSNRDLMVNASSNELLVAALRSESSEAFASIVNESVTAATFQYYMLNNIMTPTMMVAEVLFGDDDESDNETVQGLLRQLGHARSKIRGKKSRSNRLSFDPYLEAQQCLSDIESQINDEKNALEFIIGLWNKQQQQMLEERINELYKSAEKLLPLRNKAYDLVQQYASSFARIRCCLHSAQDLAKFDGIEPIVQNDDSQSTVYSVHQAAWGQETNLIVKRLNQSMIDKPDMAYFEGQYHLKVKSLNIPYVIDVLYLYEKILTDGTRTLWMFFPTVGENMKSFIQQSNQEISLDKAIDIIARIALALGCLHQNELVHRNVIASNVIIDTNQRAYLIDIGDWKNEEGYNLTTRHDTTTKDGSQNDIRGLGQLGIDLLPTIELSIKTPYQQTRLNKFKELMNKCKLASVDELISGKTIQFELKSI